ncbi:hypothetical protein CDL12_20361 [Handroanthus impetiginosus]|uniref:PLAT domain-containing protein n=1 Tax=Handroanthus impetiginosus TaxID=429701 RepID=A0A2G9GPD4_9LAMI|nr:hypothetical protein CDL12_20361 [Handroanthus impetiginosus]
MKILFFLLISSLIIFSTHARSIIPRPQPLSSLKQDEGNCNYVVIITTSLSSSSAPDDASLRFGDANGNYILAPHIDTARLHPGMEHTFEVNGTCVNATVCYLFIYVSGNEGWMPQDVSIIELGGAQLDFRFNAHVPSNTWFGHDNCFPPPPPPPANAASLAVE